ncbi:MAG: N-acetyl sugar amidotransferase [Gammaproteobacteria bacterium]|nr:N-acetyl sugar amidotransferase [Gammaproteobacteria bacterium]
MENKDVVRRYNLPSTVQFCRKCTISNQRPRISFDENGICSACSYSEYKQKINWEKREGELIALLNKHRRHDGSYDVIVPVSGGKDGGFVAHQLKYRYGMNPLTVTWAPHLYTEIGLLNFQHFVDTGFDNVVGRPNGKIHRLMTKLAFIHLGDPFQPFIYGQTNFPLRMAVQYGVPLIMYGENGEVEYGGEMKNAGVPTREVADHDGHYFSGLPPAIWKNYGLTQRDLYTYLSPDNAAIKANKTEIHFFGYYKCWDPQENFYYCQEHNDFQPSPERTEGTYSKYASLDDKLDGFHYYLAYIKFGMGRATSDTAHEIRDNKITRDEGIALVQKFDGEFPARYYQTFLEYCGITDELFEAVINSWRSDHLWSKTNGEWQLKHNIGQAVTVANRNGVSEPQVKSA